MAADASLGVFLQPPQQHPCNCLPLPNGAVIRILAADVTDVQACAVMPCHAVGHFAILGQRYDVACRLNDFVVAHGLPAKGLLPVPLNAGNSGILRGRRAMHNEVGDGSHSSGFRSG